MSKRKAPKKNVKINPEKYIREKSRNLPIYKCWINSDWETTRQANIVIAREHASSNLTVGFYLVDLGCLGIKDSFFVFNHPADEIIQKISDSYMDMDMEDISYELAHNIIFSALEYAEELGFEPAEKFTKTTVFLLEEDNDDIALISVNCGSDDGKPFYVSSEDDSEKRKRQIMAQLEKAVGEGNFKYIIGNNLSDFDEDDDDEYDDDEYDEDDEYDDEDEYDNDDEYDDYDEDFDEDFEEMKRFAREIDGISKDEQIKMFLDFENSNLDFENSNLELSLINIKKFKYLTDKLAYNFVTDKDIEDEFQKMYDDVAYYAVVSIDDFPESLFVGIETDNQKAVIELFEPTFNAIYETQKEENGEKALEKCKTVINPETPLIHYFELLYLNKNDKKKFEEKVEKYYLQYPDYFLIQLLWYNNLFTQKDITLEEKKEIFEKQRYLLSQLEKPVSNFEYNIFVFYYILNYLSLFEDKQQLLIKTIVIEEYLRDADHLFDIMSGKISILSSGIQTTILSDFFEEEKKEEKKE